MSLILDALNRSRGESGDVPGLEAAHAGHDDGQRQWRSWLPWLSLGLALVVIAWLLLDRDQPAVETVRPVVEPADPVVRPSAPAQPAAAPPAQQDPVLSATESPAQPELASSAAEVMPAQPAPGTGAAVSATRSTDKAVAALYAQPATTARAVQPEAPPTVTPATEKSEADAGDDRQGAQPPPAVQEQPVDIESMIRRAEDELENARLAEHPAPFITALSQQVKDGIPTLIYERHDYSGNAGQSRVVLNGQSLASGGATKGVRVEEILPDSVVLRYRDTTFRLRALNSWVNL